MSQGCGNSATRKAVLVSFDAGSYTAVVRLTGSLKTTLAGVPVARDIAAGEMVAGRFLAIAMFDAHNPADSVVTAVWT